MYISLEGLIIPLFFPEKSDNEIILPINLRPASQNWDAGLKNQMRGPDNNKSLSGPLRFPKTQPLVCRQVDLYWNVDSRLSIWDVDL